MNNTPKKIRDYWEEDPAMRCDRHDEGNCAGRLTKEHALIYAGKQIQEIWAILDICAFHHEVDQYAGSGGMDKKKHEWIAISRMATSDFIKYPRRNWRQDLVLLESIYGRYSQQ